MASSIKHQASGHRHGEAGMNRQRGFTLVEMSIALVIIGLVIGGIVMAVTMVDVAKTRKLTTQMENIQKGLVAFKLKYNCLPGDCRNASSMGLGLNGNGNGVVDGGPIVGATSHGCISTPASVCMTFNASIDKDWIMHSTIQGEQQYFWVHLATAGFIEGNFVSMPLSSSAVTASEMGQYFPRDALDKAYLTVFTWGGRLFIRTGLTDLTTWKMGQMRELILTAEQMGSIFYKYHTRVVIGATVYDSLLGSGQKVMPLGTSVNPAHIYYMKDASISDVFGVWPACVVSDGAGGHRFNVANRGRCNLLWELAY